MQIPSTSTLVTLALIPLLAWRIHSRFRRMVGRQRLSRVRPWITLAIYGVLCSLLAWAAARAGLMPWALLGGLIVGAVLAQYGLRVTTFDVSPGGIYYTPHTGLGVALSLLFVARIGYRVFEVYSVSGQPGGAAPDFFRSPLTLIVFGFLAGYYIAYAIGLLRYRWARLRARDARLAAQEAASRSTAALSDNADTTVTTDTAGT